MSGGRQLLGAAVTWVRERWARRRQTLGQANTSDSLRDWLGRGEGRPLATLLLAVLLLLRAGHEPRLLELLRLRTFDWFERRAPRPSPVDDSTVVIVAIDDESLKRYGQWPWPRDVLARLVDRIAAGQPLVIGLDLFFAEPDRLSPEQVLQHHPELDATAGAALRRLPAHDQTLADSLRAVPTVLAMGPVLADRPAPAPLPPALRAPVLTRDTAAGARLVQYNAVIRSIDPLIAAARGHGVVTQEPEADGVVRRLGGAVRVGEAIVPGLGIEMLRVALGVPLVVDGNRGGVRQLELGPFKVPTEPDGRIWVPFARPEPRLLVPAYAVLDGNVDLAAAFGQRMVLIGGTAVGLGDVVATPLAPTQWGVEVHAQLIQAVAAQHYLARPRWAAPLELGVGALLGLLAVVLVPPAARRIGAWPVAATVLALAALLGAGAWSCFRHRHLLVDATFPMLIVALVLPVMLLVQLEATRSRALRFEGELAAARTIQLGILPTPKRSLPAHPGFELDARMDPAKTVGGDLYDYFMLDDRRLFFVVGDVAGKGMPASLFMALSKALYKSNALRTKMNVGQMMTEANREISRENSEGMFVTMFAAILDVQTGEMEYCNAGHEPPLVLRPGQPPIEVSDIAGPAVCVLEDFEYEPSRLRLAPGDTLLGFSDGVTEAMDVHHQLYTSERLTALLARLPTATLSPEQLLSEVREDVRRFAGKAEQSDDITVLALRLPAAQAATTAT